MRAAAIMSFWPGWIGSTSPRGNLCLRANPSGQWATVQGVRRRRPRLAPLSRSSISNSEKTGRRLILGRGGPRLIQKRRADDAEGFLYGSRRRDRRGGGGGRLAYVFTRSWRGLRRGGRHVPPAEFVRRRL